MRTDLFRCFSIGRWALPVWLALAVPAARAEGGPRCADDTHLDVIMQSLPKKCPAVKDVDFTKRTHKNGAKGGSWSCPVKGGAANACQACDGEIVILKDQKKDADHFLILPRDYSSGIEDVRLTKDKTGLSYLNAAWRHRGMIELPGKPVPTDRVVLVVNPCSKRGEDWLHIHLARLNGDPPSWDSRCFQADEARKSGKGWIDADFHGYSMYFLKEEKQAIADDPFDLLAKKAGKTPLGHEGLAVVHCSNGGFLLLSDTDRFPEGDFIDGVHFKNRNPPCTCEQRDQPMNL